MIFQGFYDSLNTTLKINCTNNLNSNGIISSVSPIDNNQIIDLISNKINSIVLTGDVLGSSIISDNIQIQTTVRSVKSDFYIEGVITENLTGDQNNLNPSNATILRLIPNNNLNITGLTNGSGSRMLILINDSDFTITLTNNDNNSNSNNQFQF